MRSMTVRPTAAPERWFMKRCVILDSRKGTWEGRREGGVGRVRGRGR